MNHKVYSLTREQVRELCPSCADKMQLARIKELKLSADDLGNLLPGDEMTIKLFAGFSQGMCDKFGPDEGMFTRCAEAMSGKVDDEKAFCASLHKFCAGKWPAEKAHAMEMTREEMLVKCKKEHPDWTAEQHKAWVTKEMLKQKPVTFTADVGHEDDTTEVLEYSNCIKGVEVFKSGTHNGDQYTTQDLDDMVGAFKELDYSPAIKVGHSKDAPGSPSYGWVRNLRRVGEKLYADFEDMHDSVIDAVRKRLYDRVSSEIYFNLKRGDKTFRRALKAVALLGAEVPAVANLIPLHKMEFVEGGFDAVGAFEAALEIPTDALVETLAGRVAGLVNLMKEYDMSKNAEQIKALKAQVDEFAKKMDELKKKKGKLKDDEMMDDEEYKQLVAQADEISDKIADLENEDTDEVVNLRQELVESKTREEAAQKERKELSERMAKLEQQERNTRIGERVRVCKIPSFRAGLEALYAYALEHAGATVKIYAKKDGKDVSEDWSLAQVVDGFVTGINEQGEKLFKALAFSGTTVRADGTAEEDAGKEVQKRVSEYREKHPEVKQYEVAMSAVLKADPELAQQYRAQLGQEQ